MYLFVKNVDEVTNLDKCNHLFIKKNVNEVTNPLDKCKNTCILRNEKDLISYLICYYMKYL